MAHMAKCFQAIERLKLDADEPASGARPKGLGMVSCVGEEYVPFKTPLPLEGKVGLRRKGVRTCASCQAMGGGSLPLESRHRRDD